MLDVHPPHSAVHGWRDFLLHLATITIGLFIALTLEAAVEATHHRHLLREARENIRHEIEQNEGEARKNVASVEADAANMQTNIQKAQALRANAHALDHSEMHFNFTWSSFNDSAWRSARDTGALAFMPTSEVQTYADSYTQQEIVNSQAIFIFTHQSEIAVPLLMTSATAQMRPEEITELLHESAVTYVRLNTLKQLIESLENNYKDSLRK